MNANAGLIQGTPVWYPIGASKRTAGNVLKAIPVEVAEAGAAAGGLRRPDPWADLVRSWGGRPARQPEAGAMP